MEVKRLFAPSMKDALKLVRQQLGPDAMMLSTRQVQGGVEVTAAIEGHAATRPVPAAAAPAAPAAAAAPAAVAFSTAAAFATAAAPGSQAEPTDQEPRPMPGRMDPEGWRWLQGLGLTSDALLRVVRRKGIDPRQALADALPVLPRPTAPRSGSFAFVGASGAGKTALVSRLLTNRVLHHGRDNLAVISADCWRPGGQDELQRLCSLLEVPLLKAGNADDLRRMVAAQPGNALVLVDTAGLPVGSSAYEEQRQGLEQLNAWVNTVLVLPVTLQAQVMARHLEAARALGATGIALTRLDEAVSLGEALSMAITSDLPLVWQTTGPGIPDDLESPDAVDLVVRAETLAGIRSNVPRQFAQVLSQVAGQQPQGNQAWQ